MMILNNLLINFMSVCKLKINRNQFDHSNYYNNNYKLLENNGKKKNSY